MKPTHYSTTFLTTILIFLFTGCGTDDSVENDEPGNEPPTETFYVAFDAEDPFNEILFDDDNNRLYLIGRWNGKLTSFDYVKNEVISTVETGSAFGFSNHHFAIGKFNGETEIYVGVSEAINIYNGDLELIDSFSTSAEVIGLQYQPPNLIFATGCSGWGQVYHRETKAVISSNSGSGNCLRTRSYFDETENSNKLISVSHSTTDPELILENYNLQGELIDFIVTPGGGKSSSDIVRTNDNINYIISGEAGNFISKDDLSLFGSLDGSYNDFIITKDGDIVYGLSKGAELHKIAYPSLIVLETVDLPFSITPKTGAIIGDQLLLVSYLFGNSDVLLSKVDLL